MKTVAVLVLTLVVMLSILGAVAPDDPVDHEVRASKIPGVYLDGDVEDFVIIFFSDGRVMTSWWNIPPTLQLEDWHRRGRWAESPDGSISIKWEPKSTDRLEDLEPKVYRIDSQLKDCLRSPDGNYHMRMGGVTELRDTNARLRNERKLKEK